MSGNSAHLPAFVYLRMIKFIYPDLSDEQLLNLMQEDDPRAFEELYNRYWYKLYVCAFRRVQSREDTEEAVQNLFESLWKNRHKIHIRSSLQNYLFSAIRYIVLRMLYNRSAAPACSIEAAKDHDMASPSPEDAILANDLNEQIGRAVGQLPEKCRNVFELSRYEMKTHREIALLMGISEKTVENHITKALHRIKANLTHFFFL